MHIASPSPNHFAPKKSTNVILFGLQKLFLCLNGLLVCPLILDSVKYQIRYFSKQKTPQLKIATIAGLFCFGFSSRFWLRHEKKMAAKAILFHTRGGRESSMEDIIVVREQFCIKDLFVFIEMKFIHLFFLSKQRPHKDELKQ